MYGGASSSKSHTMAQYLILEKAYKEKHIGILVVRKTRPAVHTSCWPLIHSWLNTMELPYTENKADLTINTPTGNFFMFDGLDNIFKKKSIEGINYIWIEEAAGLYHDAIITKREFLHLDIICRAQNINGINQLFSSFNPVDPVGNEWLVLRTEGRDPSKDKSAVLQVTHWDNPFLPDEEHDRIEALADEDEEYDKIYRQGMWATPTNLIYSNWDTIGEMPERYDDTAWGLDFGYSSNPVALIEVKFAGNELYEKEHIYQTGLTNPQLIEKLNDIISNRNQMIVADCAEPKSIQEIKNAGFNIHPCKKGPDSIRHGINTVKRFKVHIINSSVNLIKEKQGYKWKVDRDENPLPEPVKFKDHLMDAERYVVQKVKGKIKAGIMTVEPDEVDKTGPDYDPFEDEDLWEAA
jgi:phage terminase large subunit